MLREGWLCSAISSHVTCAICSSSLSLSFLIDKKRGFVHAKPLSHIWFFATLWTVAHQAPLSMGILQARILEWIVMPSSRESSQSWDWTQVFHIVGRSEPPGKPDWDQQNILFILSTMLGVTKGITWGKWLSLSGLSFVHNEKNSTPHQTVTNEIR